MNETTLRGDWLDSATDLKKAYQSIQSNTILKGGTLGNYTVGNCSLNQYNPPTWTYSYSYPQRIKLTLSEIEKLRKAAKSDKAVKDILAKFTGLIEIAVDFN